MGSPWCISLDHTDSLLREQELAEEGRGRDPKEKPKFLGKGSPGAFSTFRPHRLWPRG